jgi:outer membrane protein assembly factor BamD
MIRNRTIFVGFATLLVAAMLVANIGCARKAKPMLTCEEYYELGMRHLEDKKWLKAQENFEAITYNYPGCDLVDDAQYMLGETYFRQGLYIEAQFEFRRVVEDFRLSDRMEDAQYHMALAAHEQSHPAALDQTPTEEAIFRFRQYLDDFPNGKYADEARNYIREGRKKLAQKDYIAGRFYHRLDYEEAALIYLNHVINEYPDSEEWVERARYLKSVILVDRDQPQEALVLLRTINQDQIKPKLREDVNRLITKIQSPER